MSSCIHGRRKSRCKPCGGKEICRHGRIKRFCVPCKGSSVCEHKRVRTACKECGGGSICEHGIRRVWCFKCLPLSFARNRLLFFRTQAKRRGHVLPKITAEDLLYRMKTDKTCFGCEGSLDWSAKRTPHLHHDHGTGYVFGFCHPNCNLAEGLLAKLTPEQRRQFVLNFFPEDFVAPGTRQHG